MRGGEGVVIWTSLMPMIVGNPQFMDIQTIVNVCFCLQDHCRTLFVEWKGEDWKSMVYVVALFIHFYAEDNHLTATQLLAELMTPTAACSCCIIDFIYFQPVIVAWFNSLTIGQHWKYFNINVNNIHIVIVSRIIWRLKWYDSVDCWRRI